MKLVFITLITLITAGSMRAGAQEVNVSASIIEAFQASFKNASDVQWKETGSYMKADFNMNGQYVSAFYDQNANLFAVTKNISPVQLPVTLQTSLKASYEDYWVSELFEFSDHSGTVYYTTIENGDTRITLKSIGGNWITYKKARKS
jgi:post-segregation antitoxin (ccd killing protein)